MSKSALITALALLTFAPAQPASAQGAAPAAAQAATGARVVLPDGVVPTRYEITVTPDQKAMTFAGHVDIDLQVRTPTQTIVLNAAELAFSRVALSGVAGPPAVTMDPARQTAALTFAAPAAAGAHRLSIDYTGRINAHPAGLFGLAYDTAAGPRTALFTQFENSDARRFVPCWDEPDRKAVFRLTAVTPRGLMAVSNMPAAAVSDAGSGLVRTTFADTPKMSSYLLFFGLGDFERIHQDVDGVDVGVVFKRGDAEQARYALASEAGILRYYNDYFGIRYPLPKLDMIAGPGQSQTFGAMENWGAIFYFERTLLLDPATATESDRQGVWGVVAHETAHQWFGDLVTMDWWDDLWLNEGFATWMAGKATAVLHPEWDTAPWSAASKEGAMALDAKAGTHPVITPIHDVLQAQQAFDGITYVKGAAVIRMLESYVGEDAWRAGVRNYIRRYAYGNTVTDDLWREVDAMSPRKLTAIAHDFTLQPGVPLISAEPAADGGVRLVQGRFGLDAASRSPLRWRTPVNTRAADGGSTALTVVDGTATLPSVLVVNADQRGYFRTAYAPALFARVAAAYASLPAADQVGIVDDAWALGRAGDAPVSEVLSLAEHAPARADPAVWARIVDVLTDMDDLYDAGPGRARFRAFARRLVAPVYARLGWDAAPGEAASDSRLRPTLIAALSQFDDPAVINEARRRFTAFLSAPATLTPAVRRSVLNVVAAHADAREWEQLHGLARSAPTALTKDEYYTLLATAEDDALRRKTLDLAVSGEPPVTTAPTLIDYVSLRAPELAFDFYVAHMGAVDAALEPGARPEYGPRLLYASHDPASIAKLDAFADAHIPATARGEVVKAEAAIRDAAASRRLTDDVDAWLAARS